MGWARNDGGAPCLQGICRLTNSCSVLLPASDDSHTFLFAVNGGEPRTCDAACFPQWTQLLNGHLTISHRWRTKQEEKRKANPERKGVWLLTPLPNRSDMFLPSLY